MLPDTFYFSPFYLLLLACMFILSGSAVIAICWAGKNGQMKNLRKGSESIFDSEEPIKEPTDSFPGEFRKMKKCIQSTKK